MDSGCPRPEVGEMIEAIRKAGLRVTYTRIAVVEELVRRSGEHPSVSEIFDAVRGRIQSTSFSTVYNVINTLASLGLLWLFEHGGETRVDTVRVPHVNLIVGDEIKDICGDATEELRGLVEKLEGRSGRKIAKAILMAYAEEEE